MSSHTEQGKTAAHRELATLGPYIIKRVFPCHIIFALVGADN